jgi:hypothetical protein
MKGMYLGNVGSTKLPVRPAAPLGVTRRLGQLLRKLWALAECAGRGASAGLRFGRMGV